MPVLTRELLQKRSEHNEGMVSTLEEISLHQEELEGINEVLGMNCRKVKILYLQNNIIPKMENLHHLKDLVYLNLALNNIQKIEGLQNCEFLQKLDLTVNFVDFDELKSSIEHLVSRQNLTELFMMGNAAQVNWDKFNFYVIAKLPQLRSLDGQQITKSMQIQARQQLPQLEIELDILARKCRADKAVHAQEKALKEAQASVTKKGAVDVEDADDDYEEDQEMTDNTPEARVKIYKELADQKKAKALQEEANRPKKRDIEKEQQEAISAAREKEMMANGEVKQRNEGGWEFFWDETSRPGYLLLEVKIARHLDSSLIDVDVHPGHVTMIIKSKTLRLRTPDEVEASTSKCQRAKVSGNLLIIMPKVNKNGPTLLVKPDIKATARPKTASSTSGTKATGGSTRIIKPKTPSLQEMMMQEAMAAQESKTEDMAAASTDGSKTKTCSSELLSAGTAPRRSGVKTTAAAAAAGEMAPNLFEVGIDSAATGAAAGETVFKKIVEIEEITDLD